MKMKRNLLASLAVASTIGFFTPLTSHAFGLGKLELMSALNEPFKAEIDVTALKADEKNNLQVRIASSDEFDKAGLERSVLLSQFQFDIVERQGKTRILVTSKQPIKEPFLDFLLTATAGQGRLIREYTVLLDPPEYVLAETRAASSSSPAISSPAPAETKPTTTRYQYPAGTGQSATSYGPVQVQRNDTLWNIALETRPDQSISVHQMMMALLKANQDAFSGQNINGLKAGYTLQIPSADSIKALSQSAAVAAVSEQNQLWKERNIKPVSTTVIDSEPSAKSEQTVTETQPSGDNETSSADDEAAATTGDAAAGEEEARLKLVAPEEATTEDDADLNAQGNPDVRQLTEQLTLAQETIEAQTQENLDFKARMDAMEEQLETMHRLISLKDNDLARLQAMLEEENPELAAATMADMQSDEAASPAQDTADSAADTAETATAGNDEQPQSNPDSGIITDTAKMLNLDEQEVQSVVDKVKQWVAEHKLETALGSLLILLILWLIARRRNREITWEEAVGKMEKSKAAAPAVVIAAGDEKSDIFTDAPTGTVSEKSVAELVEQADMFEGYADYVQARTSLEQARQLEPYNTLVAYKLLFVLYKQNQTDEFVELVEETQFDKDSYEWHEIKQWGLELLPGSELFIDKAPEIEDVQVEDEESAETATVDDTAETESEEPDHIAFDLNDFADEPGAESKEAEKPVAQEEDDLLAFDINFDREEETTDSEDPEQTLDMPEQADDDQTLSFDIDSDLTQPVDNEDDLAEADLDFGNDEDEPDLEFDVGDLDDIDEAETKLDLAAAYIDMGDPDGAKSILNEVLVEGNEEQKTRAHSLLDSLS
jgi:pilus assembly protein FimV